MTSLLGILFPLTFNRFLCVWGTVSICVVAGAILAQPTLIWFKRYALQKAHRSKHGKENWTPTTEWLLWLHHIQALLISGHTLGSAFRQHPPPGSVHSAEELPTEEFLSLELQRFRESPGWASMNLRLLAVSLRHGCALGPVIESMIGFQTHWLNTLRNLDEELRPVRVQVLVSILIPILILLITWLVLRPATVSSELLLASICGFCAGYTWLFIEMVQLKNLLWSLPTCTAPHSSLRALLFPKLIRFGTMAGMPLESALRFSFTAWDGNGVPPTLEQLRASHDRPESFATWFPVAWWNHLRSVFLNHLDEGNELGRPIDSLSTLWFQEWHHAVQARLRMAPLRVLRPLALFIVPAALLMMVAPFIGSLSF